MRCSVDLTSEKIGAKIAKAHAEKTPYMLVVGPKEAQEQTVSVRMRGTNETKTMSVEELISALNKKISDKSVDFML